MEITCEVKCFMMRNSIQSSLRCATSNPSTNILEHIKISSSSCRKSLNVIFGKTSLLSEAAMKHRCYEGKIELHVCQKFSLRTLCVFFPGKVSLYPRPATSTDHFQQFRRKVLLVIFSSASSIFHASTANQSLISFF